MDSRSNLIVRVWIGHPFKDGQFSGTAFFIDQTTLVTAKHVILSRSGKIYDSIYISDTIDGGTVPITPTLCKRDIAILKVQKRFDIPTVPFSYNLQEGIEVKVWGFHDKVGSKRSFIHHVSGYLNTQHTYELQSHLTKGLSGSPVFFENKICGIAQAISSKKNLTYIIPITEICYDKVNYPNNKIINPYKGLESFEYQDREDYYGREAESQKIAKKLKTSRLFTLLGASGSGKSSLIFAGIKPKIENDNIEIISFKPQSHPFKKLAFYFISAIYDDKAKEIDELDNLANKLMHFKTKADNLIGSFLYKKGIKHLYLIIDQFEELFTMVESLEERKIFLDQLLTIINSDLNVTLFISMRTDFLSHLSAHESFNQAYNNHESISLSLLNHHHLKSVIEQPALKHGVKFQDGLVDRIINEIENQSGQLPLLEFALEQLWSKKNAKVITHELLDKMQSIPHAISFYADEVYNEYSNRESIKKVFIKLVNVGQGTEDTRKIASIEDFDQEERATIIYLADKRLIVTQKETIDIVHEALIREWKEFQKWIEHYRSFLEWEKGLKYDRATYEESGDFLSGSKLLRAKEFLKTHNEFISPFDREFIKKSLNEKKRKEEKDKEERKKEQKRKEQRNAIAFILLSLIITVISYFWRDASIAKEKIQNMFYKVTVQQGLTQRDYLDNPLKSRFIFADAVSQSVNSEQEQNAKILYQSNSINAYNLKKTIKWEKKIAFYPHKTDTFSWNKDNEVTISNLKIGNKRVLQLEHDARINGLQLSKNRNKLLSWSYTVKLWDIENGKLLHSFNYNAYINGANFDKNETKILSWSRDNSIKIWDIETETLLQTFRQDKDVHGAVFNRDETRIISWSGFDKFIYIWDIKNKKLLYKLEHENLIDWVRLNKTENKIISWDGDGVITIWSTIDGRRLDTLIYNGKIRDIQFEKNEIKVLNWNENKITFWDKSTLPLTDLTYDKLREEANQQDITKVISWEWNWEDEDKTIAYWNSKIGEKLKKNGINFLKDEFYDLYDPRVILAKDKTKALLLYDDKNHTIKFLDREHNRSFISRKRDKYKDGGGIVIGAIFNQDATEFLSLRGKEKTLKLWNIESGQVVNILKHDSYILGAIFNQDTTKVLSWSKDNHIKLWNTKNGQLLLTLRVPYKLNGAMFSKDEKQIIFWNKNKIKSYDLYPKIEIDKKHYPLKTQVETGAEVTPSGEIETLSKKAWETRKREYEKIKEELK